MSDKKIKDKKLSDIVNNSNAYNFMLKEVGVSNEVADKYAPKLGVSNGFRHD